MRTCRIGIMPARPPTGLPEPPEEVPALVRICSPALEHAGIMRQPGAGEGIRTLDPNLGKVMLYP
jgi:hypothetical protein